MLWCGPKEGVWGKGAQIIVYVLGEKRPVWTRSISHTVQAACLTERWVYALTDRAQLHCLPRRAFENAYTLKLPASATYAALEPVQSNPPLLAALSSTGRLLLLTPPNDQPTTLNISRMPLTQACLGTDETLLIADAEGQVAVVRANKVVKQWAGATGGVALSVHPRHPYVAGAGVDGIVRVWEYPSGKLLTALAGHRWDVQSCVFDESGDLLLTLGSDGQVLVWAWRETQVPKTWLRAPQNPTHARLHRDARGRIWLLTPTHTHQLNLQTSQWQSITLHHAQKEVQQP